MFNRIAPTYDILNRILSLGIDRRWRSKTIERMGISERSVVLDLACGTGDLMAEAARKNAMALFGIDPSKEMLLRARSKLRYALTRTYYLESFGEELPLKSEICTHAMIAFGIRNVQERSRAFAELNRVLKPGGVLLLIAPHEWEVHQSPHDYFRYTRHGIQYLLDEAGLRLEDIAPAGGYFRLMSRRLLTGLQFFPGVLKLPAALVLAPLALVMPLLEPLDHDKNFTLGYRCLARKAR